MMGLRRFSGVARPLELDYPTNRWIGVVALAVLVGAWVVRGVASGDWLAAAAWAGLAALAVFLAWALCRELDPDREQIAFLAAGLALIGLAVTGLPSIGALFVMLLATRVLNRTTGVAATPLDALGLLALALWLASEGGWLYLAVAVAALMVDGLLPPRELRRLAAGAGATVLALGVMAVIAAEPAPFEPQALPFLLGVLFGAVFVPTLQAADRVAATADDTGEPLVPLRLRTAQVLALVAALGVVLWRGADGLAELMPLWAAMVAAGVGRLSRRAT